MSNDHRAERGQGANQRVAQSAAGGWCADLVLAVPCPRLFGRDGELTALRQSLADAESAHGRTVVLAGETGIDKSRLLTEVVVHAWNLACTIGFEPTIESRLAAGLYDFWSAIPLDEARARGAFGPALPVDQGATAAALRTPGG